MPKFLIAAAAVATLAVAETMAPLRRRTAPRAQRAARNLLLAAASAAAVGILQSFLVRPLQQRVVRERLGLLPRLGLPRPLEVAAGVLLLDYSLWWWHRANHEVPFLWRFHRTHHLDPDLDLATAFRFDPGEMSLSVFLRAAQLRLIGPDAFTMTLWQTMLGVSVLFHHSNTRLPLAVDNGLAGVFVTPRMHGIHHSIIPEEASSNWASLFTCWDLLHGTLRLDVPQDEIVIGAPD